MQCAGRTHHVIHLARVSCGVAVAIGTGVAPETLAHWEGDY
jgi:hypothetical protein